MLARVYMVDPGSLILWDGGGRAARSQSSCPSSRNTELEANTHPAGCLSYASHPTPFQALCISLTILLLSPYVPPTPPSHACGQPEPAAAFPPPPPPEAEPGPENKGSAWRSVVRTVPRPKKRRDPSNPASPKAITAGPGAMPPMSPPPQPPAWAQWKRMSRLCFFAS